MSSLSSSVSAAVRSCPLVLPAPRRAGLSRARGQPKLPPRAGPTTLDRLVDWPTATPLDDDPASSVPDALSPRSRLQGNRAPPSRRVQSVAALSSPWLRPSSSPLPPLASSAAAASAAAAAP